MDKYKPYILAVFFASLFVTGFMVYDDYGVSWDEFNQKRVGKATYEYMKNPSGEFNYPFLNKYYGPVLQYTMEYLEGLFKLTDMRDVIMMRHLVLFIIFFIGVIFFYLLVSKWLGGWIWGLVGSVFLVLSPRISGEACFNHKDIPIMCMFIITMYTLTLFFEKKTIPRILLHALTSAVLLSLRIIGVFIPALTILLLSAECVSLRRSKEKLLEIMGYLLVYVVFTAGFTYILWPLLWAHPVKNFLGALLWHRGEFKWAEFLVVYMGNVYQANSVPWHYTLVWMALTIPALYIILFFPGLYIVARDLFRTRTPVRVKRRNFILLSWLFPPIIAVIFLRTSLFHGWRHHYFIYPAFLIIAIEALRRVFAWAAAFQPAVTGRRIISAVLILSAVQSFMVYGYMERNHPLEYIYFNEFAGGAKGAKYRFDMDYAEVSYRIILSKLTSYDQRSRLNVCAESMVAKFNSFLLPLDELARLHLVFDVGQGADYYAGTYYGRNSKYDYDDEILNASVDGVSVSSIFKINRAGPENAK